jgi:hypothetical protein
LDVTGLKDRGEVDALIRNLVRRRALRAYGVDQRMVEVAPDVLRDFLLTDWLTQDVDGTRRPSISAVDLAQKVATDVSAGRPMPFVKQIVRALGRMEFLAEPPLRLIDPLADAAVSVTEAAADTIEQERALQFSKLFAFLRPGHFAKIAASLRTRDVAEGANETAFARFVVPRRHITEALPRELSVALRGATSRHERLALLREVLALVDLQERSAGPNRGYRGIEPAADVLPRALHNRHGYRSSNYAEAGELAREALDALEQGQPPNASSRVLLSALVEIDRHEAYTDSVDENVLKLENFSILPDGEPGKVVAEIRGRLWSLATTSTLERSTTALAWMLLEHTHENLNRARSNAFWLTLVSDDLKRCQSFAESAASSLENLHGVRRLWVWHARHDDDLTLRAQAERCEAIYRSHPLVAKFGPLFGEEWTITSEGPDPQTVFPPGSSLKDVELFFDEALLFTATHAEQWREHRVRTFAWDVGFKRGDDDMIQQFIDEHLRAGSDDPSFAVALSMAAGRVRASRDGRLRNSLSESLAHAASCCETEASTLALLSTLYVESGSPTAKGFGDEDCRFVLGNIDAGLHRLSPEHKFFVLGRLSARNIAALTASETELNATAVTETGAAMTSFVRGLWDALPLELSSSDVPTPVLRRVIAMMFKVPDLQIFTRGQLEWELRQMLKQMTRLSLLDFVALIRDRHDRFGDHNRRDSTSGGFRLIHLLAPDDCCLYDAFEKVSGETAEDLQAVRDLLRLAEQDMTVEFDLPDVLSTLDPDGKIVPNEIADKIESHATSSLDPLIELCKYGRSYPLNSLSWRKIATSACRRAEDLSLSEEDGHYVYDSLADSTHSGSWSGPAGELHSRWQSAIDDAKRFLGEEAAPELMPLWRWRLECAERDLVIERGRLEERNR